MNGVRDSYFETLLAPHFLDLIDKEAAEKMVQEAHKNLIKYEIKAKGSPCPAVEAEVRVYTHQPHGGFLFTFLINEQVILVFALQAYPACCAIQQFHTFSYAETAVLPEEKLHLLLDAVFRLASPDVGSWRSRRLIVMMVESRPGYSNCSSNHQLDEIPPIEKPHILYKYFYNYFMKQKKVKTRLMWNKNTGNIIHDMEVVFSN